MVTYPQSTISYSLTWPMWQWTTIWKAYNMEWIICTFISAFMPVLIPNFCANKNEQRTLSLFHGQSWLHEIAIVYQGHFHYRHKRIHWKCVLLTNKVYHITCLAFIQLESPILVFLYQYCYHINNNYEGYESVNTHTSDLWLVLSFKRIQKWCMLYTSSSGFKCKIYRCTHKSIILFRIAHNVWEDWRETTHIWLLCI